MEMIPEAILDAIEPIFPRKKTRIGRPEMCPRRALNAMWYVIKTGCQWSMLPHELGKASTVHGKFIQWCRSGVMKKIMDSARKIYEENNPKNNWYAVDSSSKKAPFANFGGKNPTDRAKRGIKHVLVVDRKGAPIYVHVAPANTHDSKLFEPILAQIKKKKKVRIMAADSAFDVKHLYKKSKEKNIALIAIPNPRRRKNVHRFNVPHRWIVEQAFGILSWLRGLKNCWAKTIESSLGFLQLAASIRLLKMI
jgi:putative transposase